MALVVSPAWLAANYLFNLSLDYTSVAPRNVSTFCFLFFKDVKTWRLFDVFKAWDLMKQARNVEITSSSETVVETNCGFIWKNHFLNSEVGPTSTLTSSRISSLYRVR